MERWLRGVSKKNVASTSNVSSDKETEKADTDEGTDPGTSATCTADESRKRQGLFVNTNTSPSHKKRKYDSSYLLLGFTATGNSEAPDALCILCNKILSNSSLAPAKLRRHFETNHSEYKNKDIKFFERKLESLEKTKHFMSKMLSDNERVTMASYKVSYRIALAGKAHTISETLIKPCIKDVVQCMFDEKSCQQIDKISFSNNTVSRRIHDMAEDIEQELILRLQLCDEYSLQLDETTDVANLSVLLVFVRYYYNGSIEEDMLLCKSLETNTTGEMIFKCIDDFMESRGIRWEKCVDVCSDGAKSMIGPVKGAVTRIKNVSKTCTSSHCVLHRHALVARKIPSSLKCILDEAIKIINFVKTRPLKSRLFKIICEDMGSQHTSLLLHTEIRWLSRGKVLVRLFELREELAIFLQNDKFTLADRFRKVSWLIQLAYLADIFTKLNDVSLSLQGKNVNIFNTKDKLRSLLRKLQYWTVAVEENNMDPFPTLNDFSQESNSKIDEEIRKEIISHLKSITAALNEYFPQLNDDTNYWVFNPFDIKEKPDELSTSEYENLIDLTSDAQIKIRFNQLSLNEFWCDLKEEYPNLFKKAIRCLLPFSTTYLCESGFSLYTATKTKYRSKLDATPDIRIQLSTIKPNFEKILEEKKKFNPSH